MDAGAVSEGKDIEKRSLTVAALIASPASGRGKLKHAPPQHGRCGYQPTGLPLVLLVQPLLQRREVVADGGGVHLARAGDLFQRLLPGPALAHLQHGVQPARRLPCCRRSSSGSAARCSRRPATARGETGTAECPPGNSACRGRWRRRDTSRRDRNPLRCGSTGGAMPWYFSRSSHHVSLYFSGGISPENTFQRHWSITRPKGRNAIFSSALCSSRPMSFEVSGRLVEQPELHQVFGRDRERDGVADGLVEAVVGAVAEQGGCLL